MRRTERIDSPVVRLPVRDEGADADDRVIDVLGKLVADRLPHLHVGLADKVVGGREPAEVGHSLQVPHDDARFHRFLLKQLLREEPFPISYLLKVHGALRAHQPPARSGHPLR